MHQPLTGRGDQTAVQPGSAKKFALVTVIAFTICIVGAIVGATSAECKVAQSDSYNAYPGPQLHGYAWVQGANYCWSAIILTPITGAFMVVAASLTVATLSQLSKLAPVQANQSHFRCMVIWGLILTGLATVLSINEASFAATDGISGQYQCQYAPSNSDCSWEASQFQSWLSDLQRRSRSRHTFFIVTSWVWVVYCLFALVVMSRVKYWCCIRCKEDCAHCVSSKSGWDTCLCCLMAPGEGTAVVAYKNISRAQPLVVAGDIDASVAQLQNEVEFWLTNELMMPQYLEAFTRNGFDRMEAVVYGIEGEDDLREVVPDIRKGHVVLILRNLSMKRQREHVGEDTGSAYYPELRSSRAEGNVQQSIL